MYGKPCYEYHPDLPQVFVDAYKLSQPPGTVLSLHDEGQLINELTNSVDNHKKQSASKHHKVIPCLNTQFILLLKKF